MRLPRRVPWASLSELDEVCAWIYADQNDIDAKHRAIRRLAAWRVITPLPHALESTHAILCAIVQDSTSPTSTSYLSLRQSYAAAIIRLVNGLVDPLQLGAYARSIASIAAQLGLPPWLVELRHAATHEDLPSIEILRDAARDAMTWLLNNYFLPTLNPSAPPPTNTRPLHPIGPLLKRYKTLLKAISRDASLRNPYKTEVTKVLREIERWIAEAKVAANVSSGTFDWDIAGNGEDPEQDLKEKWALEKFCDSLLEKGSLVPLSKKKRAVTSSFQPPASTLSIWTPLLSHVTVLHPTLPSTLINKIISHLTPNVDVPLTDVFQQQENISLEDDTSTNRELSYDICLASWAKWIVDNWEVEDIDTDDDDDENENGGGDREQKLRREDVVISLITALGPTKEANNVTSEKESKAYDSIPNRYSRIIWLMSKISAYALHSPRALLKALCSGYPRLQEVTSLLSITNQNSSSRSVRIQVFSCWPTLSHTPLTILPLFIYMTNYYLYTGVD
ncbi:Las1-like-domain-containing protein [Abortiporus biennis]|nr:Las1-like-domain-containing protein [Abortiporus biennis]